MELENFSTNPEVNALHSPKEVLRKLPSSIVYTAEYDPREDDGKKWTELLVDVNVPIEHVSMKVTSACTLSNMIKGCYSGYFNYTLRVCKEQVHKIKEWKDSVEGNK